MRMLALACLATLVTVTSLADPVEAGRRRRRRVAVAAGAVALAARRPAVVAVAAARPVVAAPIVAQATVVSLAPDLTISKLSAEGDLQCVMVKNIGQVASPETRLRIDFRRAADQFLVATKTMRVLPLQVNQAIRFRLHALPHGPVQLVAQVDPDQQVAETNEQNNDLSMEIAIQPPTMEPAPLDDVDVWVAPQVIDSKDP